VVRGRRYVQSRRLPQRRSNARRTEGVVLTPRIR
jgi:hypothetical protein